MGASDKRIVTFAPTTPVLPTPLTPVQYMHTAYWSVDTMHVSTAILTHMILLFWEAMIVITGVRTGYH